MSWHYSPLCLYSDFGVLAPSNTNHCILSARAGHVYLHDSLGDFVVHFMGCVCTSGLSKVLDEYSKSIYKQNPEFVSDRSGEMANCGAQKIDRSYAFDSRSKASIESFTHFAT